MTIREKSIMSTPIHAVIFDHDGTLVNSEPVHMKCWQEVLRNYNAELSQEDYNRHLSGMPSIYSATWLAAKFNLDIEPGALLSSKQKLLQEFLTIQGFPLMPGVDTLLQYLQQKRIPLAVATGAGRDEVTHSLTFHKMTSYFQAVVCKDDVAQNKPAPDVYQLAATRLQVPTENCIAIEDSDNGEKSARAAGMRCLRFQYAENKPAQAVVGGFLNYDGIHHWLIERLDAGQTGL